MSLSLCPARYAQLSSNQSSLPSCYTQANPLSVAARTGLGHCGVMVVPATPSEIPSGQGADFSNLALTTFYHLACVEGPDRGAVIPLDSGTLVGRGPETGLVDPALSRRHCRVSLDATQPTRWFWGRLKRLPVAYLHDLSATNPVRASIWRRSWRRVRLRVTHTAGRAGCPIFLGKRIRLGSGLWVARPRPTDLHWPHPPKTASGRRTLTTWLRFVPLVMLAFLLTRFTPLPKGAVFIVLAASVLTAGSMIIARRHRRRRHFDPAFLHLAVLTELAGQKVPAKAAPISQRIWQTQWGGKTLDVAAGATVGVVGPSAHGDARWLAAQIFLISPQLSWFDDTRADIPPPADHPWLWIKGPDSNADDLKRMAPAGTVVVAWGASIPSLPSAVSQIVPSKAAVGTNWLPALDSALPPSRENTDLLPKTVTFDELRILVSPSEIKNNWLRFQNFQPQKGLYSRWAVPVGLTLGGPSDDYETFFLDLARMGPHALLAGGTGSGKSVGLRSWLWSLALHVPPSSLRLLIIDYKGGAGLGSLSSLPHAERVVTDLESDTTTWILRRLRHVLQQRKQDLATAGFADITEWEESDDAISAPPRLLMVIDEFQTLGEEHPQVLDSITRLAAQGRSLGLHLLLATQRPGRAINADLRATIDLRVALHCVEDLDSLAIRGDNKAALLPRVPGRALCAETRFQFALPENIGPQLETGNDTRVFDSLLLDFPPAPPLWPKPLPRELKLCDAGGRISSSPRDDDWGLALGVRENTELGESLRTFYWAGEPLLLAGPNSAGPELAVTAQNVGLRGAAASGIPAFLIGDVPNRKDQWTNVFNPSDIGAISWLFRTALRGGKAMIVILEFGLLLQEFDYRGLGLEANTMWNQLIAQAQRKEIELVVTESKGTVKAKRIPSKLFRLPQKSVWTDPGLFHLLPSLMTIGEESPNVFVPSREEAVSAIPGRFLADGFADLTSGQPLEPTMVQLAAPNLADLTREQILAGQPRLVRSLKTASLSVPELRILGGFEGQLERIRASSPPSMRLTHIDSSQWISSFQNLDSPLLIVSPTQEVLRFLASRYPPEELWLKANYPYEDNLVIFYHRNRLSLFTVD